ncbi:MAG: hypothetical protein IJ232_10275 [Lachnospiraceae bacterium]|nr:hypothetical protein [Lachnospiraceae bacterium]
MAKVYQFDGASAFDNNENGVMDSNDYEEHIFSDDYKKKKQHILAAYRELPQERSKSVVKVAVALLAVMLISGTTLAYGSDLLDAFFREGKSKIDSKYLLTNLAETSYGGDVELLTDPENEYVDVKVLTVGKSKHTVTVAYVITLNDVVIPEVDGYVLTAIRPSVKNDKVMGIVDDMPDPYENSYLEDGGVIKGLDGFYKKDTGLAPNQILVYNEYRWDDHIDITSAKDVEITLDGISGYYMSEKLDDSGNPDTIIRKLMPERYTWKLIIPLSQSEDYVDCCYDIDETIDVADNKYCIHRIDVTPITLSVMIDAHGIEVLNDTDSTEEKTYEGKPSMLDKETFDFMNFMTGKIYMIMSDGKKIKWENIGSATSVEHTDDGSISIDSFWFDVPIDPSQVVGVQVDGKLIMFEDYK